MADDVFFLKNADSLRYLFAADAGLVLTHDPYLDSGDKWVRRDLGANRFALENAATGSWLEGRNDGWVWLCQRNANSTAQQWTSDTGKHSSVLRNVGTRQVLDCDEDQRAFTRPPNGEPHQEWAFKATQATPDGFTAESLKQAVRFLFEDKDYRISGPVEVAPGKSVDFVLEPGEYGSRFYSKIYIETTDKHVDAGPGRDGGELPAEVGGISQLSGDSILKVLVSSRGFSDAAAKKLRAQKVSACSYDQFHSGLWQF